MFQVDLVVNHNVPRSPKTYVHRVGRSARAGRFGGAITFVTQYDITLLQEVEKLVGKKLDKLNVSDKKVRYKSILRLLSIQLMEDRRELVALILVFMVSFFLPSTFSLSLGQSDTRISIYAEG